MKHHLRQFSSLGMIPSKQGPKPENKWLLAVAHVLACVICVAWASPAFAVSPVIVNAPDSVATEDVDYTYAVDASDADGDPLTFSLLIAPSGMVINVDSGVIQWTPLQDHVGDTTVSVEVSDGALMDTLTYTLTVLPTNDPPVVTVPDTTFAEDGTLVLDMKPLVSDPDDPTNQIVWSVSGTSAITATIEDTVITLEALEDFEGSEQLTFTATDPGGLSHSDVATITVTPVNDAPAIFGTPDTTATEGIDYTFTVEASDDADGDVVTFSLLVAPGGMVIDASTGVISWLPNQANVGDTTVSVRAADPSGAADTLTYTLKVLNANSAPSIAIGDQSFDEDDSLTIDMSLLIDDVDDTNGDLLIEVSGNSNIVVIVTGQSVKLKGQPDYSGTE